MSHSYFPVTTQQVQQLFPHLPAAEVAEIHSVLVTLGNQLSLMPLTHTEIVSAITLLSRS